MTNKIKQSEMNSHNLEHQLWVAFHEFVDKNQHQTSLTVSHNIHVVHILIDLGKGWCISRIMNSHSHNFLISNQTVLK